MDIFLAVLPSLLTPIFLVLLGLIIGRRMERRHFERLKDREAAFSHIKVLSVKKLTRDHPIEGALVSGNVVIAQDYFKFIAALIKQIFGGKLRGYEAMLERARREAVLRMQEKAEQMGADTIYNVRFEFNVIGAPAPESRAAASGAELLAYGTAVKYADSR